jgi:hypothetical protein
MADLILGVFQRCFAAGSQITPLAIAALDPDQLRVPLREEVQPPASGVKAAVSAATT